METPTLNKIRVRGRLLQFASDSNDFGTELDQQPTLGTVEFTCDYPGPRPLVHIPSKSFYYPVPVTALIRADGVVCPPANGVAPVPGEIPDSSDDPFVPLTAPQGNGFNVTDWTWTAKWVPGKDQKWKPFEQVIPPSDGSEPVDLTEYGVTAHSPGVAEPITYKVASLNDVPAAYRPGIDLVVTPDGIIHGSRNI